MGRRLIAEIGGGGSSRVASRSRISLPQNLFTKNSQSDSGFPDEATQNQTGAPRSPRPAIHRDSCVGERRTAGPSAPLGMTKGREICRAPFPNTTVLIAFNPTVILFSS